MNDRHSQDGQGIGLDKTTGRSSASPRWPWLLALLVLVAVAAGLYFFWGDQQPEQAAKPSDPAAGEQAKSDSTAGVPGAPAPSKHGKVVQMGPGTVQGAQGQQPGAGEVREQSARKKPFGLDKSVDAVVRSDEAVQIGDKRITIDELERKLVVEQRGDLRDKSLKAGDKVVTAWGVYMVRPGDNLWKVHYLLLREYLANRGVNLPPKADMPTPQGKSSGVGKVLKFAEHMVGVYNLRTGHMSQNLDLLEPGQKAVVFNLSEIFAQLDKVDPKELNGIMYDGRVLFFPKPSAAAGH
jgi:hypothetical protein